VRLGLLAALVAAICGLTWLSIAPNRLLPGQPIGAVRALGFLAPGIVILAVAAEIAGLLRVAGHGISVALLLAAIALALAGAGLAADRFLEGQPHFARAMLGPGFWLTIAALVGLAFEHGRLTTFRFAPAIVVLWLGAILSIGWGTGLFDHLSLAVEYKARMAAVDAAIAQHVVLSASALAIASVIALTLGWVSFRSPSAEATVNAVLGAVQVTPAIALFGLLIPLLSSVLVAVPGLRSFGLAAVGPAPALIGVAVYLALPLLRGFVSGLKAADPAVVEAAQAMGMSEARTILDVRVPLGLPILIGAFRVAAVQSIGLMVLGGLIGAGGLGAVVFEGMSQLAADLILLGAIPIIALALAVDAAMVGLAKVFGYPQ
jgi:osmoprotectant transport system permease protein